MFDSDLFVGIVLICLCTKKKEDACIGDKQHMYFYKQHLKHQQNLTKSVFQCAGLSKIVLFIFVGGNVY